MMSYNFDFAFLQEQILEPLFRKLNNIKFLTLVSSFPQQIHDKWVDTFFPVYNKRAQWNSTKLAFEYVLNKEYNFGPSPPYIFIDNAESTDTNVFLYNTGETLITNQVYSFNDSNTNGIYTMYNPFGTYALNDKVRSFGGLIYIAKVNNPPPNTLFNTNYWLLDTYVYNDNDTLNIIDFVVYIPQTLYSLDFETRIKGFIDTIKLFNTKYTISYF